MGKTTFRPQRHLALPALFLLLLASCGGEKEVYKPSPFIYNAELLAEPVPLIDAELQVSLPLGWTPLDSARMDSFRRMLGATELGLAGCMVASIDRDRLRAALGIPDPLEILLVLALGKAGETVMLEPVNDGNIRYWRDEHDRHHVPKRSLEEITVEIGP